MWCWWLVFDVGDLTCHQYIWSPSSVTNINVDSTSGCVNLYESYSMILPRITVMIVQTRTSSLASKLTYFSSIKSNVSNYVQFHVRLKVKCHLPYYIVVDTVYRFEIGFDLGWKQIRKTLFRKMGKCLKQKYITRIGREQP